MPGIFHITQCIYQVRTLSFEPKKINEFIFAVKSSFIIDFYFCLLNLFSKLSFKENNLKSKQILPKIECSSLKF